MNMHPAPDQPATMEDALLAQGVDARAIERARRVATETGQRLELVLQQLGLVGERSLAEAYAALLGTVVAAPARYPAIPVAAAEALAPRFLRNLRVLPVALEDGALVVAAADPMDPFIEEAIAAATGLPVRIEVAVPIDVEAALNRLHPEEAAAGTPDAPGSDTPNEADTERLKDLASEAPVIRLVNTIIARAVETQASDIHIEPFEDQLRIRYRHDGVLSKAESPPASMAAAITSRIKIMAKLDIAERRLPQDGRIKLAVRGQDVDFRVSTVASMYGETVVLRILDRTNAVFDYERLGISALVRARLDAAFALPNGIVLVTGPTGSGKTTTLYTGLSSINSMDRKIVTIEDPIEYNLAGINQIQTKAQIGLTFAHLLRAILRQDPDVIMVGEIRDLETAQIAVQAALTGHLVLSTLHTNSAAATVSRLRDMGLEDYLMTAVLRGILAQRLVRRLCKDCRRPHQAAPALVERFGLDRAGHGKPVTLWNAVGCEHCRNTGYRGRQAICEFLEPSDEIERLVFARAGVAEIERAAVAGGMVTMFQAGLDACLAGDTTLQEVARSIGAEG